MSRPDGTSERCMAVRLHALAASLTLALAFIPTDAISAPASQRWTTYTNDAAGLVFEYPAGIFTEEKGDPTESLREKTPDRAGRIFTTADEKAILQFGTFPNLDDSSVEDLRKRAIAASYNDAKIEYNRTAENWYVLSGTRGLETFYERVHFSCKGRRLDIFTVTYPSAQASFYDEIVDEIARRERPVLAKVRCPSV